MTLPTVVIVGRPNVGKSTLFNRIVGEQVAIVEDRPGVTRDRNETEAEWLGHHFLLVDTGGWLPDGGSVLDEKVSRQVEAAVKTADPSSFAGGSSVSGAAPILEIKNLVKHGNSWALVIDRPILDLLKMRPEDPLEITTDGTTMTIAPVAASPGKTRVRAASKKINARYKQVFKKLAE